MRKIANNAKHFIILLTLKVEEGYSRTARRIGVMRDRRIVIVSISPNDQHRSRLIKTTMKQNSLEIHGITMKSMVVYPNDNILRVTSVDAASIANDGPWLLVSSTRQNKVGMVVKFATSWFDFRQNTQINPPVLFVKIGLTFLICPVNRYLLLIGRTSM